MAHPVVMRPSWRPTVVARERGPENAGTAGDLRPCPSHAKQTHEDRKGPRAANCLSALDCGANRFHFRPKQASFAEPSIWPEKL
jgi:hypothetical protein